MGTCKSCGEVFNTNDMKDGLCINCGEKPLKVEIIPTNKSNEVIVTDIKMPFLSMVIFMIKWVLASIPAMIILMIVFTVVTAILGISMGNMFSHRGY